MGASVDHQGTLQSPVPPCPHCKLCKRQQSVQTANNEARRPHLRLETLISFRTSRRMRRHISGALRPPTLSKLLRIVSSPVRARLHALHAPCAVPAARGLPSVLASTAAPLQTTQPPSRQSMSQRQPGRPQEGGSRPVQSRLGGRQPPRQPQQQPQQNQQQQQSGNNNTAAFHAAAKAAAKTSSTTAAHLTGVRFDSLSISAHTQRCAGSSFPPILRCAGHSCMARRYQGRPHRLQ